MTPEDMMKTVTKGFAGNDLRPLMDVVDDDTIWKSAAASGSPFRFGGAYRGRAGIAEVTSNIFRAYTFEKFEPRDIISNGEVVWGLFDVECHYHVPQVPNQPPKPVKYECVLRWRVRGDKLVEHQAFFDTASLLRQQGELPMPQST